MADRGLSCKNRWKYDTAQRRGGTTAQRRNGTEAQRLSDTTAQWHYGSMIQGLRGLEVFLAIVPCTFAPFSYLCPSKNLK